MTMLEVVSASDVALKNGGDAANVAWYWQHEGFTPTEAQAWLEARCFEPRAAAMLRHAGITPDEAAIITTEGRASRADTIGYKVSNGGLSVEQAERITGRGDYRA